MFAGILGAEPSAALSSAAQDAWLSVQRIADRGLSSSLGIFDPEFPFQRTSEPPPNYFLGGFVAKVIGSLAALTRSIENSLQPPIDATSPSTNLQKSLPVS